MIDTDHHGAGPQRDIAQGRHHALRRGRVVVLAAGKVRCRNQRVDPDQADGQIELTLQLDSGLVRDAADRVDSVFVSERRAIAPPGKWKRVGDSVLCGYSGQSAFQGARTFERDVDEDQPPLPLILDFTDDVKERQFWEDDDEGQPPGGGAAAAA
jgi:hypothetical protein